MKNIFWAVLVGACLCGENLLASAVEVSTATGDVIHFDNNTGLAVIEGNAVVETSTAILKADKITVNTLEKQGHLEGHVVIEQTSGTIRGTEVFYDWQLSTGLIYNSIGVSPPWRFTADRMIQVAPGKFQMIDGYLTSCDADPPHYLIRSKKADVLAGKRATMTNSRFVLDDTPVFWSPIYSRSLVPKKYSLRIEPGSSGRDGFITRTTYGYPFSPNTYTKLKWDYFQYTGNGFGIDHTYFLPTLRGEFYSYYVNDSNPDVQPESRRFNLDWNHYQKLTSRLTANAKVNFKSDQNFGNQFLGSESDGRVENSERGLLSQAGFNYQFPKASLEAEFDRTDRFDSTVSSKTFIGQVTLPRLNFNTIPLTWQHFPLYTSFSASYANQTQDRFNPNESLRYQKVVNSGIQVKKDLRIANKWTVTPTLGFNETWQDHEISTTDATTDIYQGRANTGMDIRRRFFHLVDWTISERYVVRSEKNQLGRDEAADDKGIETNQLTTSFVSRIGRDTRLTLSSGYDFRQPPRSDPSKYQHKSERITPPNLDLQVQATRTISLYFRETYSLFDPATETVVRTPLNTSGEFQISQPGRSFIFSQGFNYSKPAPGQDSELILNNKLTFYLTPKWYIDGYLSYRAVGPGGMNYKKAFPIERTIRVVRDLHCWVFRMEFSSRPDRQESSFYIDLKANMSSHKNIFQQNGSAPFVKETADVSTIFPASESKEPLGSKEPVGSKEPQK